MKKLISITYMPKLLLGFIGIFVTLTGCSWVLVANCWYLSLIPTTPIYPRSDLLTSTTSAIEGSRPVVTYEYLSPDTPESIVSFYEQGAVCREAEVGSNEICTGNATPFGEYFVYINRDSYLSSEQTTYTVEIRWHNCDISFE